MLLAEGFAEIAESDSWSLKVGGKYFFTRSGTTLVAFTVGDGYEKGNGFTVLGAHSDSPCLRLKAVPCVEKCDYLMLNTQGYGGGLWHTWFDRDLGLAGRVLVKEGDAIVARLVRINENVARIPNLAIHLTRGEERTGGFKPNLHEHARAILTTSKNMRAWEGYDAEAAKAKGHHHLHPVVTSLVADNIGVSPNDIVDMELQLIDLQTPAYGGAKNEFICSGRLDNLCSSYQSLAALIAATDVNTRTSYKSAEKATNVHVAVLFDHEEVGSNSSGGAGSQLFMDTLRRINDCLTDGSHECFMRALRKSFVVSCDMAHALHPNYQAKHDPSMAPLINEGMVIKHNANQRYATSTVSATMFREVAKKMDIPTQEFAIRADGACGSTIGPIISCLTGILTVDVGTPQYSMHSIREMMGAEDAEVGYKHLLGCLLHHPTLADQMKTMDI